MLQFLFPLQAPHQTQQEPYKMNGYVNKHKNRANLLTWSMVQPYL